MSDGTHTRAPKLGFLGLGWIGLHRMEAIATSASAEIDSICDPDARAIERAQAIAPKAWVGHSFEELLARGLDGLVIATPSALHTEQAGAALERGVAVFCQKPLGRAAAETREVVRSAERHDRLLDVDLSYRCTAGMQSIHQLVHDGTLRDIYGVDLVFHNAYGPGQSWFYDAQKSGGGALIDLGVHLIDLALWVLDYPAVTRVSSHLYAEGRKLAPGSDRVEDYAVAQLELATGVLVRVACSWKMHVGQGCEIEASFHGASHGASFRNIGGSFYDFSAHLHEGSSRRALADGPDDWGGRAALRWVNRLAHAPGFDPAARRLVDVADTIDRIYRAHHEVTT